MFFQVTKARFEEEEESWTKPCEAGSEGQSNRPVESSLEYSAEILHLDEREKEWEGLCLEQYRTSEIWK